MDNPDCIVLHPKDVHALTLIYNQLVHNLHMNRQNERHQTDIEGDNYGYKLACHKYSLIIFQLDVLLPAVRACQVDERNQEGQL